MSTRESNLKEKFRIALTSTAKVISDDFDLNKKEYARNKSKDTSSIEVDNINSPSDFIKLRAETDSSALKKKFSNNAIYQKNLPRNNSSRLSNKNSLCFSIDFSKSLSQKLSIFVVNGLSLTL